MRGRTSEAKWMSCWMTATPSRIVSACPTASLLMWWTATGCCTNSPNTKEGCCTSGPESTGAWEIWEQVPWTWGSDPCDVSWTPVKEQNRPEALKCPQQNVIKNVSIYDWGTRHPPVRLEDVFGTRFDNKLHYFPASSCMSKDSLGCGWCCYFIKSRLPSTFEMCYVIYDACDIKDESKMKMMTPCTIFYMFPEMSALIEDDKN